MDTNNKLNKKIEVIPGEVKEYEGNTFVGFLICFIILAVILTILELLNIFKITPYLNAIIKYITDFINGIIQPK